MSDRPPAPGENGRKPPSRAKSKSDRNPEPFSPADPRTVTELLDVSPGLREGGPVATAWRLVADVSTANGMEILGLALAVGCLCRELEALKREAGDGATAP